MAGPAPSSSAAKAALSELHRQERAVVARYTGGVAWGTIALAGALTLAYGATLALGAVGAIPLGLGVLLNTISAYGFYTIHHEANHGNIGGDARPGRLDRGLGRLAALPLTLDFDGYVPLHLLHHAHTNDPARDPDHVVAGRAGALPFKWLAGVVLLPTLRALPVIGEALASRAAPASDDPVARAASRRQRRFDQACFVALAGAALFGFGLEALLLWWLPGRLSALVLMVVFQWLPHHPHVETARYRNTRVNVFLLSTPALLQQDYHLMHHLFPRVPWYRYRRLFRDLRPLLEAQGARLEGRSLGPTHQPVRFS